MMLLGRASMAPVSFCELRNIPAIRLRGAAVRLHADKKNTRHF